MVGWRFRLVPILTRRASNSSRFSSVSGPEDRPHTQIVRGGGTQTSGSRCWTRRVVERPLSLGS